MPEPRGRTHHRQRVSSTFSDEIGAMLEGELSDPRIAPSYVTDVVMAPGGKSARIFVAVHGGEAEEESTLAALMTARGFIRSQLRERMGVRHVPELTFAIDRSEKLTGRMEELLARARKRERRRADSRTVAQPETQTPGHAANPDQADGPDQTGGPDHGPDQADGLDQADGRR